MKGNSKTETKNNWHWLYFWGICIILCLPILNIEPLFYPPDWGKVVVFRFIMTVLLFAFAYQFFYRKTELKLPDIKKNKIAWALCGLFLIYFISSIFSVDPLFSFWGSPLRSGGFVNFAFYILFCFLVFFVSEKEDWKKYLNLSIIVAIPICLLAFVQYYKIFSNIFMPAGDGRPSSTIGNPIFLGVYLLLLLFIAFSFGIKENIKWKKIYYFTCVALFLLTILITGSRACWLGFLIGIIYFLLFYPKKIKFVKIGIISLLILAAGIVLYSNTISKYPQFLENNKIFQSVNSRLSVSKSLDDARFKAWQTGLKMILEKPILGWGMENFSVGFDKYYFSGIGAEWWDRAHNVLVQTAADAGIPALIIYLALFGIIIWHLQKTKNQDNNLLHHAIQTTLIAYLVANFFSIDSFPTYLLFFFFIAYCLHLTQSLQHESEQKLYKNGSLWHKPIFITVGFLVTIIFLWQYNLLPLIITEKINEAESLVAQKNCDQSILILEEQNQKRSYLDGYVKLKYANLIKKCAAYYPENDLSYAQKGIELVKESVKIRPTYTRFYIYLGGFTNVIVQNQEDKKIKQSLIDEAYKYLQKAKEMAPGHPEIFIELAKVDITAENYQLVEERSAECLNANGNNGECYWIKSLAQTYLKNFDKAEEFANLAEEKGFNTKSIAALHQLVTAYAKIGDLQKVAQTYEKLIYDHQGVAEYHSYLAFTYYQIGEYQKAREEALIFGQMMPEAQSEVEEFLKLLK